jgi:hypothetical protein
MATYTDFYHASIRIDDTLASIIDDDTRKKITSINLMKYRHHKYYIVVKKFNKVVHIDDMNRNGNAIVVVVNDGYITTIMLAKLWRREYFSDGQIIGG